MKTDEAVMSASCVGKILFQIKKLPTNRQRIISKKHLMFFDRQTIITVRKSFPSILSSDEIIS